MAVEVVLAMLQRDGRWLMQLRDEIPSIVAPGCWGLFGGTSIRVKRRAGLAAPPALGPRVLG
jgi:hypothetical protein